MNLHDYKKTNRVLIEAALEPIQGTRFQPTGFPDLGAATYQVADGTQMLLVESAQSMANRLEAVCIDSLSNQIVDTLEGLPYVNVLSEDGVWMTNTLLESHRLNSPYIMESKEESFKEKLKEEMDVQDVGMPNMRRVYDTLLKYDVNCLIHGLFIAKPDFAGGRLRVPRALTSFIEASNVQVASSGGVKFDAWDPSGDIKKGFGNVPFHRDEYNGEIVAYFNIDVAQIRGYGFPQPVEDLLLALCLFKVQSFLGGDMKLRTACDLGLVNTDVTRPEGMALPSLEELEDALPQMIEGCRSYFADPPVTEVIYR